MRAFSLPFSCSPGNFGSGTSPRKSGKDKRKNCESDEFPVGLKKGIGETEKGPTGGASFPRHISNVDAFRLLSWVSPPPRTHHHLLDFRIWKIIG